MARDRTVTLPDDRALGFDDVGDPDGHPVLYVHGSPDSRRARHPDDGIATRLGIRLVAVDRPGFGLSDPDRTGTVGSFADDATRLADHLGIERFATFAWSAGAPHALAIAARHPDRVTAAAVTAGLVPFAAYAEPGILDDADAGRHLVAELGGELGAEAMAEMAAPMLAPHPCDEALALEHLREHADPARLAAFEAIPGALEAMAAGLVDAVAGGLDGIVRDLELQVEPPDVDWAAVVAPVQLWYGALDATAPPAFGRWWERTLPHATLTVDPAAGHLVALARWADILDGLRP